MSIPGLGQIPSQPTVSSTRVITLRPAWEWRFEVPFGSNLTLKILSGTAEKDGVELAQRNTYTFTGVKSKILSWHGCEIEVDGRLDNEFVAEYATPTANPANACLVLHGYLEQLRAESRRGGIEGPRILITGPKASGKTTCVKTLTSYATKMGWQPVVVNADPKEGMLSLPGTLSTSVFATVMDPEAVDGWGSTPTSGPSTVPVKLPLAFFYGRENPEEEPYFYKELMSKLASNVSARLSEDDQVYSSGVIIDGAGVDENNQSGIEDIEHIIDEFSVNIVVVVGSNNLSSELEKKFTGQKTSLGDPISIVSMDKSDGVVDRNDTFMQLSREAIIKEYFFGDTKRTLSPLIQQIDYDGIDIYKIPDQSAYGGAGVPTREKPTSPMQHWTFAIMHAAPKDSPEMIRAASVMGFVYVSQVDEERKKIKLLAPVSGRLGDRPSVWGTWPEPYINLLG